jgi:tetratricopeptide (TPR) repeat protein
MVRVSSRATLSALLAALGVVAAGCGQVGLLKGKMAFKDANQFYQQQDYKAAAEKYEETLAACRGSDATCSDPRLIAAYFFLGNSYDNQFRPAKKGDANNDAMLTKAIENYKKSAEVEQDPKIKKLAMEYLVAAYGPDKLNDPSHYTYLSRIYEENGDYEQAEQLLLKSRDMKPNDPAPYVTLAAFYNRQGEFDKTMEALHARAEKEPSNPEAFYTIATYYWEKAYRDFTTPEPDKIKFVGAGLQAVDKAIELKPDYFEALTYKGLLLRAQALLEKNPARQQQILKEADQFRDRATAVRDKQRAAGASATK